MVLFKDKIILMQFETFWAKFATLPSKQNQVKAFTLHGNKSVRHLA